MPDVLLETRNLSRAFGGLHAVEDVSLRVSRGGVHAVIGPNGAGKTTLVNLLCGQLAPTGGRILLEGRDVAGMAPHRLARLGMGRGFQRTSIFPELTCRENAWLGACPAGGDPDAALALCGLEEEAEVPAGRLGHGTARLLEIAMVLAGGPRLLLLDEPLAGMGAEEAARTTELLRRLAENHAILLVEHDMDAVFALANRVSVMVDGRLIASGPPAEIRANTEVQDAYLGRSG